jgi:transcriptional regulator with PAS, ATPase and Fis domain
VEVLIMRDTTLTLLRRDALEVPSLSLTASDASGEVARVPLALRPLVVGSAPDCDVVIADPQVSRQHCRIALGEQGIEILDMGSKNGTYIRDVAIVEARVGPGVPVTIGSTRLTVQVDGAPTVVPLSLSASFGEAIGGSLPMRALFAQLTRAASTDATVLLVGETGTGKELLARALHDASPRRAGPFEVLDCAGVSPSLLEGELFGWTRGAFTGALTARDGVLLGAHGGTLFVDELGELPLELQPKLLRALEARQVKPLGGNEWRSFDARIVCATHRDLRADVAAGTFREDLFYRVAMVEARVPPLRERRQDIPLLVERFLSEQQPPHAIDDLPPGALSLLLSHDWPGNVRELWNTVARLSLFSEIDEEMGSVPAPATLSTLRLGTLPLREARALVVEHFERQYMTSKLREHAGNVSRAAESMGVSRQFLHRLMERYGIRRDPAW